MRNAFYIVLLMGMVLSSNVLADECPKGVVRCGTTEDGLSWSISNIKDENGNDVILSNGEIAQELSIQGTGDMQNYAAKGEGIAPWRKSQTGDSDTAPTITSVVIGDGITSIGVSAFQKMTSLKSVSLPDGLKKIGVTAFNCCYYLSEINLPSSLETIEDYAFYATTLSDIDLPENLKTIKPRAFGYISTLSSIVIPENTIVISSVFKREGSSLIDIENVYCSEANTSCQALKNDPGMAEKVKFYEPTNEGYFYKNKWYANVNDIGTPNYIKKKIYTLKEAEKLSKETGNTFKLKYK